MSLLRVSHLVGCLFPLLVGACGAAPFNGLEEEGALSDDGTLSDEGALNDSALPDNGTLSSALLVSNAAASEDARERVVESDTLRVSVIAAPRPVTTTDEQMHLVYELLLENVSDVTQQPTQLDIFGSGRRDPLASFEGDGLQAILLSNEATGSLAPGAFALIFLNLPFALDAPLPRRLQHWLHREAEGSVVAVERGPSVPVVRERAVRVGAPLRGEDFVDLNGCCRRGEHTTALLPSAEGGLFLSQRYAIDFLQQENGWSFVGDPSDNANYFIFGDDVLAAAGGRIVAVGDGVPENDPTAELPPFDVETATGNYVVEALADGRFALYAHLQPGSIRVQPGQRVRRGQVLGLVGNTGNSTEPHLHFQVMDGPTLLSNGLPYVFDRFELRGHVDVSGPEPVLVPTSGPERRENRLPLDLDILSFR
jgi:hypothetical protein